MAEPAGGGEPGETVEKIMSASRSEFEASLGRLAGAPVRPDAEGRYVFGEAARRVTVDFEELPSAVLGGLMKLPRARVTLHLGALPAEERGDFLALFFKVFQRGGG